MSKANKGLTPLTRDHLDMLLYDLDLTVLPLRCLRRIRSRFSGCLLTITIRSIGCCWLAR